MAASFSYTGGQADATSSGSATVTFTSLAFSSGFNIVAFAPAAGGPVTAMTINGVVSTFLGSAGGDNFATEMWGATVSAGTSNVVVVLTGASFGSVMSYGVLSNAVTTPSTTAVLASPTTFNSSQATTNSLTVNASGIGVIALGTQTSPSAATWTNATNVGFQTNTRPAIMNMATMIGSTNPVASNQSGNIGSIIAISFDGTGGGGGGTGPMTGGNLTLMGMG